MPSGGARSRSALRAATRWTTGTRPSHRPPRPGEGLRCAHVALRMQGGSVPTATFLPVLGAEVGLPRRGGGDPLPDGARAAERVLAPRPSPTPARRPKSTPPRRSPRAARPAPARAPLTSCHTAHLVERPCQVGIGEDRDRSWQRGGDVIRGVNALGELVHEPTEGHRDLVYRLGGHHGGSGTAGGAALPTGCGHSGRGGRGGGASRCLPLPARGDRGEPAWHVRAGGRPVAAVRCPRCPGSAAFPPQLALEDKSGGNYLWGPPEYPGRHCPYKD